MANPQLELDLDLYQTSDATSDFRDWLLSLPPTPWHDPRPYQDRHHLERWLSTREQR